MAQRKQLTWSELRVGLFVLVGIVLVVCWEFSTSPARGLWAPNTAW